MRIRIVRNPVAKQLARHRGGAHVKPRASERQDKRRQLQRELKEWSNTAKA